MGRELSSKLLILSLGLLGACSDGLKVPSLGGKSAKSSAPPAAAAQGAADQTAGTAASTGTATAEATGTETAAASAPSGTGGATGTAGDANQQIQQLLADCGATDIVNAAPGTVIYDKTLTSLPFTKSVNVIVGTLTVTLGSTLEVKVTPETTAETSTVTVTDVSGLFADLARSTAEQEATTENGTATYTNLPFSDYLTLSQSGTWSGALCTFVPATKVENDRGGHQTIAEFDPPLPASISPKAAQDRYDAEIGQHRQFTGLSVKIDQSDDPALSGLTTLTGTVTVDQVPASATVDDGKGGQFAITADVAYKVTYDFGSPAATAALGLAPTVTYYISHKTQDLVANVIDTTSDNGAVAVFPAP